MTMFELKWEVTMHAAIKYTPGGTNCVAHGIRTTEFTQFISRPRSHLGPVN